MNINPPPNDDNAADLIRQKLERIYEDEPNASTEMAEAEQSAHRSKHQQFMHELGNSGKDLATIQTEWHNYYQKLSDKEKHQVWGEFYSSQGSLTNQPEITQAAPQAVSEHKHQATQQGRNHRSNRPKLKEARSTKEIKDAIRDKVTASGKLEARHHLQSLMFGVGMGLIAVVIFLFGFFNEVILAPFIQPSRVSASTPLIVGTDGVAASATPEVIIPKINVQIPVVYGQTTTEESIIESALDRGVVHYPTTSKPGEIGNSVFFGHSSNNIFNKGKYKFAFVMLHKLVIGDTFYLTYNGKVYVYKVISREIVKPSQVSVLDPVPGQTATATLITCDPPGTSLNRLVVVGQQISPDPGGNIAGSPTVTTGTTAPDSLPGNGPTLLGRFIRSTVGKIITVGLVIAAGWFAVQRITKRQSLWSSV